jgi:hypothetical protein
LSDPEIKVFWRAADQLGYPFCPLLHMLLLTGQRRSVYDQHQYVDEMREALEAWNAKLREVVA